MIATATKAEQARTGWRFAREIAQRAEEQNISLTAALDHLIRERNIALTRSQYDKAIDLAMAVERGEAPA